MNYTVRYNDGHSHMMRTVSSSSTSYDITGLTNGLTYTISVEATSDHLSGESEQMTITLCKLNLLLRHMYIIHEGVCSGDIECSFMYWNGTTLVQRFTHELSAMYCVCISYFIITP